MKTNIIIIFFMILIISCTKKKQENNYNEKTEYSKEMEKYKKEAIEFGNDDAYGSYLEYADNNGLYLEKLSFSLLINNKHKNTKSYYQIFKNIIELNNDNKFKIKYLNNLDSINASYALHYLKEGAKRNDISCQTNLEYIYRNGISIKKDIIKSDSLYSILEKIPSLEKIYKSNKKDKSKIDRIYE